MSLNTAELDAIVKGFDDRGVPGHAFNAEKITVTKSMPTPASGIDDEPVTRNECDSVLSNEH